MCNVNEIRTNELERDEVMVSRNNCTGRILYILSRNNCTTPSGTMLVAKTVPPLYEVVKHS